MSDEPSTGTLRRKIATAGALIVGLFLVWSIVWHFVQERVLSGDDYVLRVDDVELPPPPPWIQSDVRYEALRAAGLDRGLPLLDESLPRQLHDALVMHPWVEAVQRVKMSYPARAEVDLTWRRPVCMVEVPGGLFAIDAASVLLPSGDFAPLETRKYPRLAGANSIPQSEVGAPWGDPLVSAAARLAEVLAPSWNELCLESFAAVSRPPDDPSGGDTTPEGAFRFVLTARNKSQILWGPAPPHADDPTAAARLAALRSLADEGSLTEARPRDFDLREPPPVTQANTVRSRAH